MQDKSLPLTPNRRKPQGGFYKFISCDFSFADFAKPQHNSNKLDSAFGYRKVGWIAEQIAVQSEGA